MSNGNRPTPCATLSDRDTFARNYRIGHVLGKGGFGTVYAGVRVRDNLPVAIKHVAKSAVTAWGQVSLALAVTSSLNLSAFCSLCMGEIRGAFPCGARVNDTLRVAAFSRLPRANRPSFTPYMAT